MVAFVGVLAASVVAVAGVEENTKSNLRAAANRNCEAAKADRIDMARAATAQSDYLDKVLAAASVKGDVKEAATTAIKLWAESANQLRRRLYDCHDLVHDGNRHLDRDALLEAQGKL